MADERELLSKVMDYHEGRKPYDFWRLPDFERSCQAFDAWQELADEIRVCLAQGIVTRRAETLGPVSCDESPDGSVWTRVSPS